MVDWEGDGFGPAGSIDDLTGKQGAVNISRALVTDLPDAVRIVEGTAAATAAVALVEGDPSDETMHAARYFTRGSDSPIGRMERINRPCTIDIGFITEIGPQYVRRLTGLTRRLDTSSRERTATLSVLDNRARLRNTVNLQVVDGKGSGCSGTFLIVQALYANGIGAGPLPRSTGLIVWAPCYGSISPIRQDNDPSWFANFGVPPLMPQGNPTLNGKPRFRPGQFVQAADPFHISDSNFSELVIETQPPNSGQPGAWDGQNGRFEAWVLGVPSPTTAPASSLGRNYALTNNPLQGDNKRTRFGVGHDGKLFVKTYDVGGALVHSYISAAIVPNDGAWHFIGVHFDGPGQTVLFRIDTTDETVATAFGAGEIPLNPTKLQILGWSPVSDMSIHDVPRVTPWMNESVPIGAVLDISRLEMVACFEDKPREAWELIGQIAATEQAVAGFDEPGMFRYRTRSRLVDAAGQTVQRVLTTREASLLDVDIDDGVDQIRNIVQVSYQPVFYDFTPNVTIPVYIFTDSVHRILPPGATIEFTVSFSDPAIRLVQTLDAQNNFTSVAFDSFYKLTINADFTENLSTPLNLTQGSVIDWTPRAATIRITNLAQTTFYIAGVTLGGGVAVISNAVVVETRNQASIVLYGPQPLQIQMPQWVQTADLAAALAATLLGELKNPHPSVTGLRIVGDPRRQLGDRVQIADPDGVTLDGEFWLTAIRDEITEEGGYTQQISARAATRVLRWGVGKWGENVWG